jgi:hypothetical protein
MLRARCASGALTAINPGGNLYDPDEIEEIVASVPTQRREGVIEERDPGAPPPPPPVAKPKAEPPKIDPLIAKIEAAESLATLMDIDTRWGAADKSKYAEKRVTAIDAAIKKRKAELAPPAIEDAEFEEQDKNEGAESLDASLAVPAEPIPTNYDEWEKLICKAMSLARLDVVEKMVQQHVVLDGKLTGAAKKKIIDCLNDQKNEVNNRL